MAYTYFLPVIDEVKRKGRAGAEFRSWTATSLTSIETAIWWILYGSIIGRALTMQFGELCVICVQTFMICLTYTVLVNLATRGRVPGSREFSVILSSNVPPYHLNTTGDVYHPWFLTFLSHTFPTPQHRQHLGPAWAPSIGPAPPPHCVCSVLVH